MSNYTKVYDGAAKDAAQSVVTGADFDTDFSAIETAIATKLDHTAGTDNITFDISGAAKYIRGDSPVGTGLAALIFDTTGDVKLYDDVNDVDVWNWDVSATVFYMAQNFTLADAKDMILECTSTEADLIFSATSNVSYFYGSTIGDVGLYDGTNLRSVWKYEEATNTFIIGSPLLNTNPVLTTPTLDGNIAGTSMLDEDNMASDSPVRLASQQSIKAYVDNSIAAYAPPTQMYVGAVTSGGAINYSNGGITASKISTGRYRLTHNFGDNNYGIVVSGGGLGGYFVNVYEAFKGTASVDVLTRNLAGATTDYSFTYAITKY